MRRKYFLCSMGKYVCFLAVCVVMLSSCYNDDDLKNSISGLEDRMDKLEASLQSVQTDISTLKTLTDALSQNKSIASVLENEDGSYTIKFSDKTEVIIRNGENGEDAPQITVIKNEEDGIYYWGITSIDGKKTFLKDGEGKMMPERLPLLRFALIRIRKNGRFLRTVERLGNLPVFTRPEKEREIPLFLVELVRMMIMRILL